MVDEHQAVASPGGGPDRGRAREGLAHRPLAAVFRCVVAPAPRTIAAVAIERGTASAAGSSDHGDVEQVRAATAGRWLLVVVAVLFLLVVTPVVLQGSPLADDYHTCLRPVEDGSYGPFLADSWRDLGRYGRPASWRSRRSRGCASGYRSGS